MSEQQPDERALRPIDKTRQPTQKTDELPGHYAPPPDALEDEILPGRRFQEDKP